MPTPNPMPYEMPRLAQHALASLRKPNVLLLASIHLRRDRHGTLEDFPAGMWAQMGSTYVLPVPPPPGSRRWLDLRGPSENHLPWPEWARGILQAAHATGSSLVVCTEAADAVPGLPSFPAPGAQEQYKREKPLPR
jgi:hypothetical protein